MEGKLNEGSLMPKSHIEDVRKFGQLLSRSRSVLGKSRVKMAEEISLTSIPALKQWEEGISFPEEDKLLAISKAYGINPQELVLVWKTSKEAREGEKSSRKNPRPTSKKAYEPDFPASYGSKNNRGNR